MNLSYNFEFVNMIALLLVLSLVSQPRLVSSTLSISALITDENGNEVTRSVVERILSVPTNLGLVLNCTNYVEPGGNWRSTAKQLFVTTPHPTGVTATIDSFTADNIGFYKCSYKGEELEIYATTDEVATIANPQRLDVLENLYVNLSVCISAYPSYQSSLVLKWSYLGVEIPSCSSQGQTGCLVCEVRASDRFSSSNYSVEATALTFSSSESLTVSVHEFARLVAPLSPTMDIEQCKSATLFCSATGDPDLHVFWKYKSSTLYNEDKYPITTTRGQESAGDRYYTNSSLTITKVEGDTGGEYSCVFLGFSDISASSSSQLLVTPKLCLKRSIGNNMYETIPGESVQIFQGTTEDVYICFGHKPTWYRDNSLISKDNSQDVYQQSDDTFGTLYVIAPPPPPGYFSCQSGSWTLETWIYLTTSHPALITRPPGLFYSLRGSNVTIQAYLSPPEGGYTLSWRYEFNGTQQDVTERGWTITPQSEPDYYEVSISLAGLGDEQTGAISVAYETQGQVDTAYVTLLILPPPCLKLSPGDHLLLWEGSTLGVQCSLKNETVPVSDSPEWEGVSSCPSEVCSDSSTLSLSNITVSAGGNYSCSAGNAAGETQISLQVEVNPFSDELILLTYELPTQSTRRVSNSTLSLSASNNYSDNDRLLLSCSLDNSTFSTDYLSTSELTWEFNSSLSRYVHPLSSSRLSLHILSIFFRHQKSLFSADFCCHTTSDTYRMARQCIQVTFDARNTTIAPTPSPPPLQITIFIFVDNCTLLPSSDLTSHIKLALLDHIRDSCACNVSDTELHLTDQFCHCEHLENQSLDLLTLCGASTDSLYQLIGNTSLSNRHFMLGEQMFELDAVIPGYKGTHCTSTPTPTPGNNTLTPAPVPLPVWSKIILFGALPMLLFVVLIVLCLLTLYLCCRRVCSAPGKEYGLQPGGMTRMEELPGSEDNSQSDDLLTASMVVLSPSQVPQTFKTATGRGYTPQLSVPQELLSRPASTPPTQGEFPIMYSNPLALDSSGDGYSYGFANFNDNHTYYSDMPPISETAQRMPPVFATHRLLLPPLSRDPAHSSLPSPLRTTKRQYLLQQRLSHGRRSFSPTNPYPHHQLKVIHRPPSLMRTETPTFDSGVEEMDSINPRSSSSASSSASEVMPARRIRSSSLATSFPQHSLHTRGPSTDLSRNTSLPNITEACVNSFSSQANQLELYKTVKQGQRESQTLV